MKEDDLLTSRELRMMFTDVHEKLDEIKEDGKETKAQAKLTNGRVSSLENWKWFVTGGLAILSLLVVPVLIYSFTHL